MQLDIYWISGAIYRHADSIVLVLNDFRHCMLLHNHDFYFWKPFCVPFSGKVTSILHPQRIHWTGLNWCGVDGYGIVCPILIIHVFKCLTERSIIGHVEHRTAPSLERNFFLEDNAPVYDVIPNRNQLNIKHTHKYPTNRPSARSKCNLNAVMKRWERQKCMS